MSIVAAVAAVATPAAAQGPSAWPALPELPPAADDGSEPPPAPAPRAAQAHAPQDSAPQGDPQSNDAPGAPGAPSSRVTPPSGMTPAQLYERVRRGVVALERNGVPVAIGTVLAGDGRVLTALSGLGGGDGADVRYADGTVVHARVARTDKTNDLALLIPQANTWTDGLSASEIDPSSTQIRAMLPGRGAHIAPTSAILRGPAEAHDRAGDALLQMLDIDLKGAPVAGAPLLDVAGSVVGVLVRACKGAGLDGAPGGDSPATAAPGTKALAPGQPRCQPMVVGAPVSAIRAFLTRPAPAPWLGIRGEPQATATVHGVRVVAIAPSSPAEKAMLKASDVIVAVDGAPIDTPETLAAAIGRHAPGDSVKLLVFGQDKFREVVVALRSAPSSS
jgi:serine protease Do